MKCKLRKPKKINSQGTHILLSGEEERRENKSDNISEDHYMSSAPNNASTNSTNRKQPDFPAITFQPLNNSDNDINSIKPIMIKYSRNTDHDIQGDEEISQK